MVALAAEVRQAQLGQLPPVALGLQVKVTLVVAVTQGHTLPVVVAAVQVPLVETHLPYKLLEMVVLEHLVQLQVLLSHTLVEAVAALVMLPNPVRVEQVVLVVGGMEAEQQVAQQELQT